MPPENRHPSRQEYRLIELARCAKELGMPINPKPAHWPTNPAPSSYALIAAQKAGGGDVGALAFAIGRACWAEEKDIADDAVIKYCLESTGFDPSLADRGMLDGAPTYAANTEDAVNAGVFGAPFFITDGDARFWGQDRLNQLDMHLGGQLLTMAKSPLALIHCGLGRAIYCRPFLDDFGGYVSPLLIELPGHGLAEDYDETRDYSDQAVEIALEEMPSTPVPLIGHSFGAAVALRIAIERPYRISSLVLIEPVMFAAVKGRWAYDRIERVMSSVH